MESAQVHNYRPLWMRRPGHLPPEAFTSGYILETLHQDTGFGKSARTIFDALSGTYSALPDNLGLQARNAITKKWGAYGVALLAGTQKDPELLEKYSKNKAATVRKALCFNPNLPEHLIENQLGLKTSTVFLRQEPAEKVLQSSAGIAEGIFWSNHTGFSHTKETIPLLQWVCAHDNIWKTWVEHYSLAKWLLEKGDISDIDHLVQVAQKHGWIDIEMHARLLQEDNAAENVAWLDTLDPDEEYEEPEKSRYLKSVTMSDVFDNTISKIVKGVAFRDPRWQPYHRYIMQHSRHADQIIGVIDQDIIVDHIKFDGTHANMQVHARADFNQIVTRLLKTRRGEGTPFYTALIARSLKLLDIDKSYEAAREILTKANIDFSHQEMLYLWGQSNIIELLSLEELTELRDILAEVRTQNPNSSTRRTGTRVDGTAEYAVSERLFILTEDLEDFSKNMLTFNVNSSRIAPESKVGKAIFERVCQVCANDPAKWDMLGIVAEKFTGSYEELLIFVE